MSDDFLEKTGQFSSSIPVVDAIIDGVGLLEVASKAVAQSLVVGLLRVLERPCVEEVVGEDRRLALQRLPHVQRPLHLAEAVVVLVKVRQRHLRPGQPPLEEVEEDVAQRFEVVPAGLPLAEVGCNNWINNKWK